MAMGYWGKEYMEQQGGEGSDLHTTGDQDAPGTPWCLLTCVQNGSSNGD